MSFHNMNNGYSVVSKLDTIYRTSTDCHKTTAKNTIKKHCII